MQNVPALDLGVTGLLLIVIWKALSVVSQIWINKKAPPPALLACQTDPQHFQRIREIHEMTKSTEKQKATGSFACAWKGRDEVRDTLELQRQVVSALKELTTELRLTRNGNGKK